MNFFIKIIKFFVLPVLHFIRRILTIIKKHCLPNYTPEPPRLFKTSYEFYVREEEEKSYEHFKKFFKSSIFLDTERIRKYALLKALSNDKNENNYYFEFGVFKGLSINYLSQFLKTNIYGFDSFEGLKEDWKGSILESGYFDLKGKTPKVNKNVKLVKGLVQDTLVDFLSKIKNSKINFVHIDLDTYESTKFVLENIKPHLTKNAILLFDELYNFSGWDQGEYKALRDVFNENEYKFLAFSKSSCQAVIQIV